MQGEERGTHEAHREESAIPALDPLAARRALDEWPHVQLIDVREPVEFRRGRIPASRLIPMDEIPARLHEIDRDKPAILVCRSGARSERVAQYLRALGYDQVYNLAGGLEAWVEASLPVER